jgi:Tfp pilus assembly protein PilO
MVSFFGFFALKPTIVTIVNLQSQIKLKKDVDLKLGQKVQALQKAQLSFAKAQNDLSIIDKTLPPGADFTRFERELEYLAVKNNIILFDGRFGGFNVIGNPKVSSTKKTVSNLNYTTLDFNLGISGSYQNLKNFLKDLENLDRLVTINNLSFSKQTQTKGAELQIKLNAQTFYLPENEN